MSQKGKSSLKYNETKWSPHGRKNNTQGGFLKYTQVSTWNCPSEHAIMDQIGVIDWCSESHCVNLLLWGYNRYKSRTIV